MTPQPQPIFPILYIRDEHDNSTALTNNTAVANSTITATPNPKPDDPKPGGFPAFLIAVIIIGALFGLGFFGFILYRRRASHHRAFGSGPGPSLDGAKSTLSNFWYKLRNPRDRNASAGFEGISAGRAQHRGRALDPDEAWDSRVGAEADHYYEDTELQGTTYRGNTEYHGAAGAASGGMPAENPFGDEHATGKVAQNPFGDEHEAHSHVRSVSPRPVVDTGVPGAPAQISPTRRSLFKENV